MKFTLPCTLLLVAILTGCSSVPPANFGSADDWYVHMRQGIKDSHDATGSELQDARERIGKSVVQINKLDPSFYSRLMATGVEQSNLYNLANAADIFEVATYLRPKDPTPWYYLGIIKFEQRDTVAADAAWLQATNLSSDPIIWGNLAVAANQLGAKTAATAFSVKAVSLDRTTVVDHNGLIVQTTPNPLLWYTFNKSLQK